MTKILLDFSRRTELALEASIVGAVDVAAALARVRTMIVGAFARDLHLHYGHGIPVQRATDDLDLALAVADWADFQSLRERLIASKAFQPIPKAAHKLIHESRVLVDLVPFGKVETAERRIAWPPNGDVVMDVFGFTEALAAAQEVMLPGGVRARLVSLAALASLKITCWNERHHRSPRKDAQDLQLILKNYLAADNEIRLWEEFIDWTQDEDFDYELAGARMVGHDIRSLFDPTDRRNVVDILEEQSDPNTPGALPSEMDPSDPERAARLLKAVLVGLTADRKE